MKSQIQSFFDVKTIRVKTRLSKMGNFGNLGVAKGPKGGNSIGALLQS